LRRTPTAEEELILLLCGTAERRWRATARIDELAQTVDYEAVGALMARQLLLPILGTRLLEIAPERVPAEFSGLLEETLAATRRHGIAMEVLATQIRQDLGDAGIAALPLKGAALARNVHGDPGMRLAKDVDILVESEQLEKAAEVLGRRGYRRVETAPDEHARLHLSLEHEHSDLPRVEVHWRVHWYEDAFSQLMLRRSRPAPEGLRAKPADELASLLLFFSRDGLAGLRLPVDAAAWWDANGTEDGVPLLDGIVDEFPELREALSAAALTLDRLVGIPANAVLSRHSGSRRALAASRLANWTVTGDWDQINANLTLVDLLLSPPGGGRSFVRRSLLPPNAEISSMYRLPPSAFLRLAFWRLAHGPKLLVRYLIALWTVRRGRPWVQLPASASD
jgi:Uncharacterised nucleotidyltransferase